MTDLFFKLIILLFILGISACKHNSNNSTPSPELGEVMYSVKFDSTWSSTTHPDGFPSNPHYSGLIGATHNSNVSFWDINEHASTGIEQVAETGSKSIFTTEINQQIMTGDTNLLVSEGGINPSPGSISFSVIMHPSYTFISLVSMLAPSPDWIVGVSGLDLAPNGVWLESKIIDLYVYDAGTDNGENYTSANLDANPKQVISRIESSPFLVNNTVISIGTMTFTKQ